MKILILEDDKERIKQFKWWAYQNHQLTIVSTVGDTISELEENEFDLLCLDHDLGQEVYVESTGKEETGYLVALWLAENPERKPEHIIIHSLNTVGRENMKAVLPEATVYPFVWMNTIEEIFQIGEKA